MKNIETSGITLKKEISSRESLIGLLESPISQYNKQQREQTMSHVDTLPAHPPLALNL